MSDPISDMLTRLRNALKAKHEKVDMPSSNLKVDIAKILKREGYISNYKVVNDKKQGVLKVALKYDESKSPAIEGLRRVSKPSIRKYTNKDDVPVTLSGYGITILSTSKGVISDKEAKTLNVGGEIICQIW